MTWQLQPAHSAFPAFAAEWDRLNRELYGGHPFFDSRFVGPLLEHFGAGDELLCTHRTDNACDGALILRPRGLGRWTLFLPAQAQIGAVLLRDASRLETLFAALPGHAWTIDLLAQDPGYCPDWSGLTLPRRQFRHSLTMAVAVKGSFEDYWQSCSRHLASNLRRYQRRTAERFDRQDFISIQAAPEIHAAVARYGELESAGWKGKQGTAVSIDNPQGRFYEKLLQSFALTGQARIIEYRLGGQLAASRLAILHDRMWIMLKTSYDESLATLAPGRQLLLETLRQAFAGLDTGTVEFYTNATADQAEWATDLRFIHHHQLYRNRATASFHSVLHALSGRSMPGSKDIPFDPTTVAGYRSIDELPEEAASLFENAATQDVESSSGWFANLQRTVFADDSGVRYYVKTFEDAATAILPARLTRRGPIRQIEALGNYYTSLYTPILTPSARTPDLTPILKAANKDCGKAHVMRFAPMDPQSPAFDALLTALRNLGWIPFKFYCFGNWYLPVTGNWQTYLEQRDGQLRSTIKRKGKKFAADGGTLEIVTTPEQAEQAIDAFTRVYAHSWKKPEPYPEFIPGLIRWLATTGCLRLGIARLRGQPIAAQLWIVNAGKASIFKLAYDEAHAQHAPGTLLTAHLMEHVIDRDRVQEVDYLVGDDEHKKSWMSHRRERWGVIAYNPRTVIGLGLLVAETLRRITSRLLFLHKRTTTDTLVWRFYPAAEFPRLAAQWQFLCDATIRSPLLSAEFVGTALRHFGRGNELICLAENATGIVAGAILHRKNSWAWQTFQPSQMPLGPWLQNSGESLTAVATSLLRHLPGPAMILAITQIDPDFYPRQDGTVCLTINSITTGRVSLAADMTSHMATGSVKDNPERLAVMMRRMRKAEKNYGEISLTVETASEAAKDYVNRYAAIESRSWKAAGGTALAPDDLQARFYADLMREFAHRNTARMFTLRFGETVVAQQIAITGGNVIVLLKTTYEPEFRSLGPGVIQMYKVIEDAIETSGKVQIIELYGPFNDSQKLWVSETRQIYHANIYRFPLMARMHRKRIVRRNRNKD